MKTRHAAPAIILILISITGLASCKTAARAKADSATTGSSGEAGQFARWMLPAPKGLAARGGTTQGTPVVYDSANSPGWQALQQATDQKSKDRAAILAMAGEYQVTFEFQETIGFTAGYQLDRPYRSWATEKVYVITDQPDFISLQHIMVMFFKDENGQVTGPMVMKHWRQDWQFEAKKMHTFVGRHRWVRQDIEQPSGQWLQTVFQVDDAPRYGAVGAWEHTPNMSVWHSRPGNRPLPRRERSVRSDYDYLYGTNRVTILPYGWTHEQFNDKVALTPDGSQKGKLLAREIGLNRYMRIKDFDFSAGDAYWQKTAPFWAEVRQVWTQHLTKKEALQVVFRLNKKPRFVDLFDYADKIKTGQVQFQSSTSRAKIEKAIAPYITPVSAGSGQAY